MTETAAEYRKMFDRVTSIGSVVLISLVFCLTIWGIYYARQYGGIVTVDAFNQAQVAREFYFGHGLTTQVINPVGLLLGGPAERIPEIYLSPLPVIILARFMALIGLNDGALLGYSLFWAFLTGVTLFIFARIVFKGLVIAALTFILYMTNYGLLESAFSGQSFPLISLFLLLYFWLYYKWNRQSLIGSAFLGGLAGLLYLCEYDFLFLALPLVGFLVFDARSRRRSHALCFIGAFLLVSLPWLVRNLAVVGDPFFSLRRLDLKSYSLLFPGNRISRDFSALRLFAPFGIPLFWNKFIMFVRLMAPIWPAFSLSFLTPCFLAGLFFRFRDRALTRMARAAVALFFGQLILIAAGNGDFSRTLYFIPLLVIGGMAVFWELLLRLRLEKPVFLRILPAGFVLVNLLPGLISLAYGLPSPRYLPALFTSEEASQLGEDGPMERIQKLVRPDEVVASDIPWAVAWYANRRSVWIPWEIEQMREIKELVPRVRFLHLSPAIFKYPEIENVRQWQQIYRSGRVPDWLEVDRGLLLPGEHLIMGDIIFERLDLE